MPTANKDKRTKEQLLQILSNALTQEELLGEKIKKLESELATCQKMGEDSRAEINQYGLSASKESFRIDYYKTTQHGRLKGIIEHLPTRQKKSFKGLGIKLIGQFMEPFLPESAQAENVVITNEIPAETVQEKKILENESENAPAVLASFVDKVPGQPSALAQRLRARLQREYLPVSNPPGPVDQPALTVPMPQKTAVTEQAVTKIARHVLIGNNERIIQQPLSMPKPSQRTSGLLERLQAEHRQANRLLVDKT